MNFVELKTIDPRTRWPMNNYSIKPQKREIIPEYGEKTCKIIPPEFHREDTENNKDFLRVPLWLLRVSPCNIDMLPTHRTFHDPVIGYSKKRFIS